MNLQESQIIYRSVFHFSLYCWNQAHTMHIGHYDKSLILHKNPFYKIHTPHSPLLFDQENTTEKCHFSNFNDNIYWQLCVLFFNFSVISSSEMQFGVIHLKTCDGTQTYVAFSPLECCSCLFVFWQKTQCWILLHCISQGLLWLVSRLFSWHMDGACIPCLAVKCQVEEGQYWCWAVLL
jgi:hypothetical protein